MEILEELQKNQILNVEISSDKKEMVLTEGCDLFFKVSLSKSKAQELINELQGIVNKMAA